MVCGFDRASSSSAIAELNVCHRGRSRLAIDSLSDLYSCQSTGQGTSTQEEKNGAQKLEIPKWIFVFSGAARTVFRNGF